MFRAKFLEEYHLKHFLENRKEKGLITPEEQEELDRLTDKYHKFFHRIGAKQSYNPK